MSLECRWDGGKQSFPATLQLLHDAASCLEIVHAADTVHRDIKPDNILFMVQSRCVSSVLASKRAISMNVRFSGTHE